MRKWNKKNYDTTQYFNEDTVNVYPDYERDRRLDAAKNGRYGGFTADSLNREIERRRRYFKSIGEEDPDARWYGEKES